MFETNTRLVEPPERDAACKSASIKALLAMHQTQCFDLGGELQEARMMLPTWRRLWDEFPAYVKVRNLILQGDAKDRFCVSEASAFGLVNHLVDVGLLESCGKSYRVSGREAAQRLRGSWLEELGAVIASDAGCEEVRFSQRLVWQSRYSSDVYHNEVDVLARCGEELIFVSCKALAPLSCERPKGVDHIFDAMKEVAYWRQHFNGGRGRAVLLTTADLFNEEQRKYRNAGLMEHSDVLNVKLVTADAGDCYGLVLSFRRAILAASDISHGAT